MEYKVKDIDTTDNVDLDLFAPPRKGKTFEIDYMQLMYGDKVELELYEQKEGLASDFYKN